MKTNENRIRAVVFDMDGLMFNTEDVYAAVGARMLRRRGHEFTAELKNQMMGLRPRPAFEAMIRHCNLAEKWRELAAESNRLFLEILGGRLKPMPGLMELLDALERAKIPKAIGTSSSRELVAACLKPFGFVGRFQFVLAAEDVENGKPHPEIYLTVARRLGIQPGEMMVLEDSENGCAAAAAAGAFAVAVPGEHSREHDFGAALLVVDSLSDPQLYRVLGITPRGQGV
ncbi:MAG: HAD family phosphatase [Planctomycetes bacterium]|nr:HAD family phosphatase [Planctomycetota bacterium]MBU4398518.1 HAD family phosphatase [Planctomycetota bacterium]MCG2684814.1 HAD family phosphatase [Planctomycetales bacterium]